MYYSCLESIFTQFVIRMIILNVLFNPDNAPSYSTPLRMPIFDKEFYTWFPIHLNHQSSFYQLVNSWCGTASQNRVFPLEFFAVKTPGQNILVIGDKVSMLFEYCSKVHGPVLLSRQ